MDEITSVHGIYSYRIDEVWPEIEPMLEEAIKYSDGKFTAKCVKDALTTKEMQLWVAVNKKEKIQAFAVTQIVNYPAKRVMIIMFASGSCLEKWLHFIHILKNYAEYQDCRSIEIYGRKGWEKKLAPYGYQTIHSVYRLELKGGYHEEDLDEKRI